jgi:hypothetical protein
MVSGFEWSNGFKPQQSNQSEKNIIKCNVELLTFNISFQLVLPHYNK